VSCMLKNISSSYKPLSDVFSVMVTFPVLSILFDHCVCYIKCQIWLIYPEWSICNEFLLNNVACLSPFFLTKTCNTEIIIIIFFSNLEKENWELAVSQSS
jgi:hypothetical protein